MFEITCAKCGAVFTNESSAIPQCLECTCASKEFQILEITN